ncbi:Eukaryotic aspartyl protease family protein [Metarhizium album ARSEF 1941]|uniref:Eukaryotic aspartyl protease family protein n=1 Tax=Metarhizium album (strain ARSEF 1941) TaxID=1081103 RepID=A0A0B2WPN5_METAS|nr:Eukaryotic aspartyl protease family protein [Metarhizium album ARSEF 1941]KHN98006.1 Eukaryotic aspartyl protease family protein [Metarhizium album ARSEF 1941]
MKAQAAFTAVAVATASVAPIVKATEPQPVAFSPTEWLGNDGNWSTFGFRVGSNNNVNVLFSTALSEFWAVGPGGCNKSMTLSIWSMILRRLLISLAADDPHCSSNRGGIYYPSDSKHWSLLGTWQLGLPDLGTGGNGQYGFDSISGLNPMTNTGYQMSNVLVSAINSTDYFLGFFGVGMRSGNFGDIVATPPIRQAVASFGWVSSYSYGYTAGASYRNSVGSATLGGFDAARLAMHDIVFTLNQTEGVPRPLIRGIEVSSSNGSSWKSATRILLNYNSAFTAVIDTTTPYLWLPPALCDNFAKALNLTYNETFQLYTLTNEQYRQYSSNSNLAFVFSFSSMDNRDNFGDPLDVTGVVNITVPVTAFVSLLSCPFMREAVGYNDPAVPYFTLRKAPTNSTAIIGNAFMQEAYVVTKYDSGVFSLHQARFPSDPIADAKLTKINRPNNSPYPPPPDPNGGNGPSIGERIGIAVGAVACFSTLVFALLCYRRHKRQRPGDELDDGKDSASTLTPESPRSPVSRIFSRILGWRRSPRTGATMMASRDPSEAPDHQIYELPAPVALAELDAGGGDDNSMLDETDVGTDSTQHLSAYEIAKRKLDRQLQGPVPEYTPYANGTVVLPEKVSVAELRSTLQTHMMDQPSPISPPRSRGGDSSSNTFLASEPSPVSPRGDWNSVELPSPVTASILPRSNSSGTRSGGQSITSRSLSVNSNAPASPVNDSRFPLPAACQRTPIDPSKVVCLGTLPESIHLPGQTADSGSRIVDSGGRNASAGMFISGSRASEASLGRNFTEKDGMVEEATRGAGHLNVRPNCGQQDTLSSWLNTHKQPLSTEPGERGSETGLPKPSDPRDSPEAGRIDAGRDLIHVPQMAEKRYSWEDVS